MKIKRTDKDYGGGAGTEIFESDLFRVVLWNMEHGIKTELTIKDTGKEICFDGEHIIKSNSLCFDQLSLVEIKNIISARKRKAFNDGERSKENEIKKCLNLH